MEWAKLLVAVAATLATVSIAIGGRVLQRQKELQTADKNIGVVRKPIPWRVQRPPRTNLQHFDAGWIRANSRKGNTRVGLCFSSSVFWMGRSRKTVNGLRAGSRFHRIYQEN